MNNRESFIERMKLPNISPVVHNVLFDGYFHLVLYFILSTKIPNPKMSKYLVTNTDHMDTTAYIEVLVQDCGVLVMEMLQSCTKPSKCNIWGD